MTDQQLLSAQNLIQQNPSLAWSTKSYDQLPIEAVAEAIFNYGSWREFLQLQEILGIQSLARTFAKLDSMLWNNLLPIYRNYFRHYMKNSKMLLPCLRTCPSPLSKAFALGRRAKWKDYVDLFFTLQASFYTRSYGPGSRILW